MHVSEVSVTGVDIHRIESTISLLTSYDSKLTLKFYAEISAVYKTKHASGREIQLFLRGDSPSQQMYMKGS